MQHIHMQYAHVVLGHFLCNYLHYTAYVNCEMLFHMCEIQV